MSVIQAKSLHEAEDLLNSGIVKKVEVTGVRKSLRAKNTLLSPSKSGLFLPMISRQRKATF